eukprot:scaffold4372_cov397-Prasinococcus_capsulatus_cf.AAC.38
MKLCLRVIRPYPGPCVAGERLAEKARAGAAGQPASRRFAAAYGSQTGTGPTPGTGAASWRARGRGGRMHGVVPRPATSVASDRRARLDGTAHGRAGVQTMRDGALRRSEAPRESLSRQMGRAQPGAGQSSAVQEEDGRGDAARWEGQAVRS